MERNPLARPLRQRRAKSRDRLLEPRCPALPRAECVERIAEIYLRHRPLERNPLARPFLQRRAIDRDRLLEPRCPALPLAERPKRIAEIVLRRRPVERRQRPRIFRQGAPVDFYGTAQRRVVAALLALSIKGVGLTSQIPAALARMSVRNVAGRLTEQLGRLKIAALGQRDAAFGRGRTRRAEHLRIFGRLRLLREPARLLRRGDLRLGRLTQ